MCCTNIIESIHKAAGEALGIREQPKSKNLWWTEEIAHLVDQKRLRTGEIVEIDESTVSQAIKILKNLKILRARMIIFKTIEKFD
ncbi:hypothetical protein HUJ04_011185 [Dendroctonus ponderosae]|nr:hypothetical protein HUJ04_011185 [Dendroctonus ponderosae]